MLDPEEEGFAPIPVHVLSGFLGAGKTTAIRELLARRGETERIAVVVNEFGELGVDGALLSDCASCILKEVPGGCVCCTAMADLEASVEEILPIVAPTRFVIEPTGLARPSEIVDLFRRERFAGRFEIRPVITLLDPLHDYRRSYAEGGLFKDQVDVGDVLVISRCDLASEAEIRAAEEWIAELHPPKLLVVRAAKGVLPDAAWDLPLPVGVEREESDHLSLLPSVGPAVGRGHGPSAGEEGYEGHGFGRGPERLFDADRLERFVTSLASGGLGLEGTVVRAKGIFRTSTGWRVHEIAGGRVTSETTAYRRDSRFDVILRHRGASDFAAVDAALEEALVADGAALLSVETASELVRAFDLRALRERFPSGSAPLGALLSSAAAPASPWAWLVSDGGLFGAGGPREVLEKGTVAWDGEPDAPFRFALDEEAAGGEAELFDTCQDVPALCAIRLVEEPGAPAPLEEP